MSSKINKNKKPVMGKYILETLSIGMYNHPLMLIREYIQNSSDAIDDICKIGELKRENAKIKINIIGQARSLTIKDNGSGIPAKKAWKILYNIGLSSKKINANRGFRGIGRLGGLGYCEELKFVTKAKGEKIYSTNIWNCNKVKELINGNNTIRDVSNIVKGVTQFYQYSYSGNINDHFFIVEMNNVRSSRDMLIDVPVIKAYLSEVAPVPFNNFEFRHAKRIEKELRSRLPNYETYKIYVNGEQIFKPYKDIFNISKQKNDRIEDVEFIEFKNDSGLLAFGWLAKLKLLGVINSSNHIDGIRIRSGNILIGDKNVLSDFFRERRFNNCLIGEIHITDHRLIPNSRRDDFEDNRFKEEFYDCFVKEIGIPFSRKIREASESRSRQKRQILQHSLVAKAKKIIKKGYLSEIQKKNIEAGLQRLKEDKNNNFDIDKINLLISDIAKTKHYLDKNKKSEAVRNKKLLKLVFDIIYKKSANKAEADEIIHKIIKNIPT